MGKYVYSFEDGGKEQKPLLGGKGANLAEMKKIGLPVPEGFTVTTEACTKYYDDGEKIDESILNEIFDHLEALEKKTDKTLGLSSNPLLVSVRSGAVVSMPGMMDTVLNLGLNDETVEGMAELTGNPRFAYDSYRRFIQMFGDVVLDIPKYEFDSILDKVKREYDAEFDTDLTVEHLKEIIKRYKRVVVKETKNPFPTEPREQLKMAIDAVFRSWNNPRAIVYRNISEIPHELGTAVNIQSMVFGNMGETSGTGVAFTRNPSNGENVLYGEFLLNAQGEDVVAGIRTPRPIAELETSMPEVYKQFAEIAHRLENHYKDMQDIEFTIERGKLYFLQTRNGKRTANAAVNVAVDMVQEGIIDKETALLRVEPIQLDQLLHPSFDPKMLSEAKMITKGLPASPGAASGKVYFHSEDVKEAAAKGEDALLIRTETSPEDIEGMIAAQGILTARGGMTSHAAVVARGMGKCCIAGCGEIRVDEQSRVFRIAGKEYHEGDYVSLDGNTGAVYEGLIKTKDIKLSGKFAELMAWADDTRMLGIRANADNPKDSEVAVKFGAEGIGLCRTEHMFFDEERILEVRRMITSRNVEDRLEALNNLLPYQQKDFEGIFEVMRDKPVTVRLLDPPLHEFLPHGDEDIQKLAKDLSIDFNELKNTVEELKEFNPMLGHRGCRLAISYPEIYDMQVKAIFNAICVIKKTKEYDIKPEIMIPLVGHEKEIQIIVDRVKRIADEILEEEGVQCAYKVGTMIEVPRAALTADSIAKHAEFFSFGTNDLTQMTLGFSRDDSGKFIDEYKRSEIFERDPFESIDQQGVGSLMKIARDLGRAERNNIKLGICGEHGGDPKSIAFCHEIGLDYVSCSPYRIPIARLAAAQAAIRASQE